MSKCEITTSCTAGLHNHIAITQVEEILQQRLPESDSKRDILDCAKRRDAPALRAEGALIPVGNVLAGQNIDVVLMLLKNPVRPKAAHQQQRQTERKCQAKRDQLEPDKKHESEPQNQERADGWQHCQQEENPERPPDHCLALVV